MFLLKNYGISASLVHLMEALTFLTEFFDRILKLDAEVLQFHILALQLLQPLFA
jgi:hypothetical protein